MTSVNVQGAAKNVVSSRCYYSVDYYPFKPKAQKRKSHVLQPQGLLDHVYHHTSDSRPRLDALPV